MDKCIIQKAQSGDMDAFESLYKEQELFVWKIVCRMMDNIQDREDVFQDVFIKIYQNIDKFQFRSKFSTWVYKIAMSTILNYMEKYKRRVIINNLFFREAPVQDDDMNLDPDADKEVANILKILNPIQRSCVVLKEIEDLSYKEISEVLKIKIGTVRSNLNRARELLRKKWQPEEGAGIYAMQAS